MVDAVFFIIDGIGAVVNKLDSYSFETFGFSVSLIDIFVGFIAMSIVIGVFWKGARG